MRLHIWPQVGARRSSLVFPPEIGQADARCHFAFAWGIAHFSASKTENIRYLTFTEQLDTTKQLIIFVKQVCTVAQSVF